MKQGKLTAVVAVRKGSQRIPNKNITPFGDSNFIRNEIKLIKEG
jgi:CMP-N-acetylneuraminic acid synthetase